MYYIVNTERWAVRIFLRFRDCFLKGGPMLAGNTPKEVITAMSYESMMVMLTFGLLIVSLIGVVVVIVKNMKK